MTTVSYSLQALALAFIIIYSVFGEKAKWQVIVAMNAAYYAFSDRATPVLVSAIVYFLSANRRKHDHVCLKTEPEQRTF